MGQESVLHGTASAGRLARPWPPHTTTALRRISSRLSGASVVGSPGVAERVGPVRHGHKAPQRQTPLCSFKSTQACAHSPGATGSPVCSGPAVQHGKRTPPRPSTSLLTAVRPCHATPSSHPMAVSRTYMCPLCRPGLSSDLAVCCFTTLNSNAACTTATLRAACSG